MRRVLLIFALLCLALPARAGDDPFADFRIPAHRTRSGQLVFTISGNRIRSLDLREDQARPSGRLSFATGWDSDALQFDVQASGAEMVDWTRSHSGGPSGWSEGERQSRYGSGRLSADLRRYLETVPLGFEVGAGLDADEQVYWSDGNGFVDYGDTREYTSGAFSAPTWATRLSTRAGVVYGRVRDAGVVYAVHVLEQRLRAAGALERELSPAARQKLAGLLDLRPEFASVHDHPDRAFAAELERLLREDGAIAPSGLDASTTLRALESLEPVGPVSSRVGASIGVYVRVDQTNRRLTREDRHTTSTYDTGGALLSYDELSWSIQQRIVLDEKWAGVAARYCRPVGWAWLFDLSGTVEHPLAPKDPGLRLTLDATARWRIAERWDAGASARQSRLYLGPEDWGRDVLIDEWQNDLVGDVGFYVEDHLRLSAGVTSSQSHTASAQFRHDIRYDVALTCRFLGALDAPGLLASVR